MAELDLLAATASRWGDLITITLGPIGLVVSLAALGYTIHQVRRTRTAAEAAARAADRAARSLVQNHLLFLIPDMTRLVSEAELAITADEAARTSEVLSQWRTAASRMRGLLRARGDLPRPLAAAFTGAFGIIAETKTSLRLPDVDVVEVTEPAMRAVDRVMDEIGDLGGQLLGDPQVVE